VSLLNYLVADLNNMLSEMPIFCVYKGERFMANRTEYTRGNELQDGGFMNSATMTITAIYNSTTQKISIGDKVTINGSGFRVIGAELSQDAVSVNFDLEDINR